MSKDPMGSPDFSSVQEVKHFAATKGVVIYYSWSIQEMRNSLIENWEYDIEAESCEDYCAEYREYIKILSTMSDQEIYTTMKDTYVPIYDQNVYENMYEKILEKYENSL